MKKISKKAMIISIAVILLVVLVLGIFVIPIRHLPAPLTIWEQRQLAKAIGEDSFNRTEWTDLEDDPRGRYYFGKYNGYYVVSSEKMTTDFRIETVGDYTFCYNSYNIAVWKDGIRFDLEYAYEQGKISAEDLGMIHKYHLETLRDFELEALEESADT